MKRLLYLVLFLFYALDASATISYSEWKEKLIAQGRKQLAEVKRQNALNDAAGNSHLNTYIVVISADAIYPNGDYISQATGSGVGSKDDYILDATALKSMDGRLLALNNKNIVDHFMLIVNFVPMEFVNMIPSDIALNEFFKGKQTNVLGSIGPQAIAEAANIVSAITKDPIADATDPTLYCGFVKFKIYRTLKNTVKTWVYYPKTSDFPLAEQYRNILNGYVRNEKFVFDDFLKVSTMITLFEKTMETYKDSKGILERFMQITEQDEMFSAINQLGAKGIAGLSLDQRVHALKVLSAHSMSDSEEVQVLNLLSTAPVADYKNLLEKLLKTNEYASDTKTLSLITCIVSGTDDSVIIWGGDRYLNLMKLLGQMVKEITKIDVDTGKYAAETDPDKQLVWDKSYALKILTWPPIGTNKYSVELKDDGTLDVTHSYVVDLDCETHTQAKSEASFTVCDPIWSPDKNVPVQPFDLVAFVNRSDLAIIDGARSAGDSVMLVPAIMLKYASDKRFNAHAAAIFFATLDVVTIVVPMTKIVTAAKIVERIYLGLDIAGRTASAVNLIALVNDNPTLDTLAQRYSAIIGIVNVAGLVAGRGITKAMADDFVEEFNQPGIKATVEKAAANGDENAKAMIKMEKELKNEGAVGAIVDALAALRVKPGIAARLKAICTKIGYDDTKFKALIDGDLGDILVKAGDADVENILIRLEAPHVNADYVDEITRRLKYSDLKQNLLDHPDWYQSFDDIVQEPNRFKEILEEGSVDLNSALKAWANGLWWKTLKQLATDFDNAVYEALALEHGADNIARQVTLDVVDNVGRTRSIRIDLIIIDRVTGAFTLIDSKFSTKVKDWDVDWLSSCTESQSVVYPMIKAGTNVRKIVVKATTTTKLDELKPLNLFNLSELALDKCRLQIYGSGATKDAAAHITTLKEIKNP